ncbi:MAG: hypothetical protein AAB885_01050, partial [Patescibacteria group bacterium]
ANIVIKNFFPFVKTTLPRLFFSRVDHPILTHLIYLPAIALFLKFWLRPSRNIALVAGIFAGLLFYTYFHIWVYWIGVLGLLFLATLIWYRREPERFKNYFVLVGTIILVSVPYFVNYFRIKALPTGTDYLNRLGLEIGSAFRLEVWPHYLVYLVLAVLIYLTFWKNSETRKRAVIHWAFLGAAVLVWNIQIVLGFVPHSDHWPRGINPLIFIAIFDLFYVWITRWLERAPKYKKFFAAGLVVLILLSVSKKIVNALAFINPPKEISSSYMLPEDALRSWQWMEKELGESRVISPSLLTSIYLTAFTSSRPFLPWGGITPISNFEVEERYLTANKLFGVSEEVLEKRFRSGKGLVCRANCDQPYALSNLRDTRVYVYQLYFLDTGDPERREIIDEKIRELIKRYRTLDIAWKDLAAEYVYYGPWEKDFTGIDLKSNPSLELIYHSGDVEIFRIKK